MSGLPPSQNWEILPSQVAALLPAIERGEIALIDCREEDEWRFNRIDGARWIPLSRFGAASLPSGPTVIYCHHGMRSLRATQHWRSLGYDQVWSMEGGIHRWSAEVDASVPIY